MANKLHSGSWILGRSYDMKIPKAYRYRHPRFLRIKRFVDISDRYIKNHSYKLLIVLMLVVLSIGIIPSLLGCRFEAIRSGSMSPALDKGGLAITLPVNPYSVEIGDVIAYYPPSAPNNLVVHRVAGINNGSSLSFLTKGDANKSLDAYLLPAEAVIGRVKFYFPWIGYLVGFAQSFPGFIIFLVIPGTIILYLELNKLWRLLSPKRTVRLRLGNLIKTSFGNLVIPPSHSNNPSVYVLRTKHRPSHRRI